MSEVKVIRRRTTEPSPADGISVIATPPARLATGPIRLLAVASSTGGPNALMQFLGGLHLTFPVPIVVVQHMNPGFMEGFADWLTSVTPFKAGVVTARTTLTPGNVYLAPSGRHLKVESYSAFPDDSPAVGGHRPSANVLFSSVARSVGPSSIGVLLTGMGEDGASGLSDLKASGAYTIAEDETTAVVYGMPAAAVRQGAVVESLPLHWVAARVSELVARRASS